MIITSSLGESIVYEIFTVLLNINNRDVIHIGMCEYIYIYIKNMVVSVILGLMNA